MSDARVLDEPQFFASPWIDRAAAVRSDPDRLAELRTRSNSRYLLFRDGRNLVADERRPTALALPPEDLPVGLVEDEVVFLGLEADRGWFAAPVDPAGDPDIPAGSRWVDLRREGPLMSARDGGLLAYARAVLHWHATHRFCGRCGSGTVVHNGGFLRRCGNDVCGREHFPRTDPAVIVRVTHGDRILLGRQRAWPERWYSVLAGFVEPGESLEDAVRREVAEETGVRLGGIDYAASQPWPFPASLMLGFTAEALSLEITPADEELEDACWLTPEQIAERTSGGILRLPPATSIARRLIDDWLVRAGRSVE